MMEILATCDAEGRHPSFFSQEIHGDAIPADAFEITVDQWHEWRANASSRRWVNGGLAVYVPPATPIDLVEYAKDASWRKEVGGIMVAGVPVATDEKSQLKVLGARVAADANPNWMTVWDGADGNSYPINAAAMVAISDAVQAHINQCFVLRAQARAGVAAGEFTTTADIDHLFA